jgi:hypothetical protein
MAHGASPAFWAHFPLLGVFSVGDFDERHAQLDNMRPVEEPAPRMAGR